MGIVDRLVPPYSGRRVAAQVLRGAVREPGRLRHRVNRQNLSTWRTYRNTTMTCNICGQHGHPYYELPDLARRHEQSIGVLRETLRCCGCGSKMRDRTVAAGLLETLRSDFGITAATIAELRTTLTGDVRILDTDAYSAMSTRLAGAPGFERSVFLPGVANGDLVDKEGAIRNVDLQQMPYPDGRLDIIITSEVMEHVRYVDTAHLEISRCLRDRGVYLFTVPFDPALDRTRALIDPDTDEPLEPLHIHGDPLRGGIKSYRIFGRDLIDDLRYAGLDARPRVMSLPDQGVYDGDLFTATRLATAAVITSAGRTQ